MPEIGATLREARMRARIDVSEIEAQTKIRAKYLRALENEEWDLLPGPTFVKSFLRTYAQALDLDGKALVEEFRRSHERPSESDLQPIGSTARGGSRQRGGPQRAGPSRAYLIGIGVVGLIVVLLVIGLLSGGGSSKNPSTTTASNGGTGSGTGTSTNHVGTTPGGGAGASHTTTHTSSTRLTLSLRPTAAVYVCLLGDGGRRLIPGAILNPGVQQPTYHANHFVLVLGNSSVALSINGKPRVVPASSNAIGYSITRAGRRVLTQAQLPTCK
jgi:cytoskeletal protein RodZ